MSNIPRGTIFGRRVGHQPKSEAEHFIRCPPSGGWIDCRVLARCSSTKVPSPGAGSTAMTGAQYEIRIDGTPRTYRDRRDYAMEAARLIKSKQPHSIVEVKDLRSGDVTAVANRLGE
jgi:hypothetical protein